MAKKKAGSIKKKRQKTYTGSDAAIQGERITRIKAEPKGKLREWYDNNKMRFLFWLAIIGVSLILYGIISFLLRLIF